MLRISGCNLLHTSIKRFPQVTQRIGPAGIQAAHETEQLFGSKWAGGNLTRESKPHVAMPLPESGATVSNQSQGDGWYHGPGVWQVARLCHSNPRKSGIPLSGRVHYRSHEQFWGGLFGRPVILRIRGASYLR